MELKKNELKVLREAKGITKTELAYNVGVGERYISFIESGDKSPSLSLAFRIAKFLKCRIEDIFLPSECTNSTQKEAQ
jgi:putative transcriptional regulator